MDALEKLKQRLLDPIEKEIDDYINELKQTIEWEITKRTNAAFDRQSDLIDRSENFVTELFPCFECGKTADHMHHVIPRSRGGTKTLPLCTKCHATVHNVRAVSNSTLIKIGIEKARAAGKKPGRPTVISSEIKERVLRLRANGMSIRTIADNIGISKSSILRILTHLTIT